MKRNIFTLLALTGAMALSAQTYNVVVTTTDGEKHVYSSENVAGITFAEKPNYLEADYCVTAEYEEYSGTGRYFFTLGTGDRSNLGNPALVGDVQVTLALSNVYDENPYYAKLPAGYYRAGSGDTPFSWDIQRSGLYIRLGEGMEGITTMFIIGSSVDVRVLDNDDYDIRAELDIVSGEHIDIQYVGPIVFNPGATVAGEFGEDQNVEFDAAAGRYWANWYYPFADDFAVQFSSGKYNASGKLVDGFWLNFDANMPKVDNPNSFVPVVADGVYTVGRGTEEVINSTFLPFTFNPGECIDFMGVPYDVHTYLLYTNEDGRTKRAYINGGTVTVSDGGKKFVFDLEASNGVKVTGFYEGKPSVVNYVSDPADVPDMVELDLDTLKGDYHLDFLPGTLGLYASLGDYINPGVNSQMLILMDESGEDGDYLSLEYFTNSYDLADGVYTLGAGVDAGTVIPGRLSFSRDIVYSWFGDLGSVDDEGYQTVIAPVREGYFTVSTVNAATGEKSITFEFLDLLGHRIYGSWQGVVIDFYGTSAKAPAKAAKAVERN